MEAPPAPSPPSALPALEVQRIKDSEHLRLLGIGYYVIGGFTALFGCFGLLYVVMGLLIFSGGIPPSPARFVPPAPPLGSAAASPPPGGTVDSPRQKSFDPDADATPPPMGSRAPKPFDPATAQPRDTDNQMPAAFGLVFAGMGGIFVLIGWTVGGLTIYAGRCLHQRRHRVFTMVMSGVNCLHLPFGTALGVFALIVLQRPTVEALYLSAGAAGPHR